ncbi:MAG: flagellar protein FlgN [Anaerolineales bacterium]|nr:flagellar protein FlgN [Anaerolineales bacterium]
MEDIPGMVTSLEDILVKEFRICQSLHIITKDERLALTKNDVPALSTLVEQKEALLDDLTQIEDHRRMLSQNLGEVFGIRADSPTLTEISKSLNADVGGRINHLRDGILAIAEEIKVLTSGNRALAMAAMERVDAVQTFLLDIFRPALSYDRPGAPKSNYTEAIWDVDQSV